MSLSSHSVSEIDAQRPSSVEAKNLEQGEDMVLINGPIDEKSLEDEINDAVS